MDNYKAHTSEYELPVKFMLTVAQCAQNGPKGINKKAAVFSHALGADPSWPVRSPILISGSYPGKRPRWFMQKGVIRLVKHNEYKRLIDEYTTIPDKPNGSPVLHAALFDFKIRANNKFQIELYRGPRCSRQIGGTYKIEDDYFSPLIDSYVMS